MSVTPILKPEDVFSPRASSVNPRSYISRPNLEVALKDSLRSPKHIVVHGESGTGKSWLYKRVLQELGYYYEVANMGLCASLGNVSTVLLKTVCREIPAEKESARELSASYILKGGISSSEKVNIHIDPFYASLEAVSLRAQQRQPVLVFDNLEQVVQNDTLVKELAGLLLLVDDERYAAHKVKIILVGTSNEVRALINNTRLSGTIANRLTEIPEVSRLTSVQCRELASRGFKDLLGYEISRDFPGFCASLEFYSDRIPQYLQELCLTLALDVERSGEIVDKEMFLKAVKRWVQTALVKDLARVENNLNSIATKIGRRNQVIYCLGALRNKYDFNASDIESKLKEEFPISSSGVALNVPQILSDLAGGEHPIICRSPKSKYFRFVDPKFRIISRWLLVKEGQSESISLRDFDEAIGLWNR